MKFSQIFFTGVECISLKFDVLNAQSAYQAGIVVQLCLRHLEVDIKQIAYPGFEEKIMHT